MEMTISEAKSQLRQSLHAGAVCPCCNQFVKMYKRKITSSMAYGLILIYKESIGRKDPYFHIENYFKTLDIPSSVRGDVPKLRFWGFIQPHEGELTDGNKNNGLYKITSLGTLFALGEITAQSHVQIYNNKMYGYAPESKNITIFDALTDKFNYQELMKN
jgi:hypothetical protein